MINKIGIQHLLFERDSEEMDQHDLILCSLLGPAVQGMICLTIIFKYLFKIQTNQMIFSINISKCPCLFLW